MLDLDDILVPGRKLSRLIDCYQPRPFQAVLLGVSSFWEGGGVQGAALSCVIIDRLLFAPQYNPVFRAKLASLHRCGYDLFPAYQLPASVIALKQEIGRLIRGSEERGVLVLCDPR